MAENHMNETYFSSGSEYGETLRRNLGQIHGAEYLRQTETGRGQEGNICGSFLINLIYCISMFSRSYFTTGRKSRSCRY